MARRGWRWARFLHIEPRLRPARWCRARRRLPECCGGYHRDNGVDRFQLRGIDEAAGVDDQDVGIAGMLRKLMAAGDQVAHNYLGVDEVFGAAETYKTDFQGG